LIDAKMPVFGICLGHQMLGSRSAQDAEDGASHHGANHPVKDLGPARSRSCDESRLHGGRETLRPRQQTMSRCSTAPIAASRRRQAVFGVQYHPEASPGPMDSHYLFDRFAHAARAEIIIMAKTP